MSTSSASSASSAAPASKASPTTPLAVPGGRPRRGWGWWYVAEHRMANVRSFWFSLLLIGLGSPFIYVMGLGLGLGVLVDRNQGGQGVDGVPYLVFVTPALLLAAVMQAAANENTYGTFGGFKWSHWYDVQYQTPIRPWEMALGSQVGVLLRNTITTGCYVLVVSLLGIAPWWRVALLLPVAMLLSVAVGFAVMSWVATQEQDRGQLGFIERFVTTPLALFSGTYYPLSVLPDPLQWIGWISPLWHAVELGRWAMYGAAIPAWLLAAHVAFLALLAAVTGCLSAATFARRLDR